MSLRTAPACAAVWPAPLSCGCSVAAAAHLHHRASAQTAHARPRTNKSPTRINSGGPRSSCPASLFFSSPQRAKGLYLHLYDAIKVVVVNESLIYNTCYYGAGRKACAVGTEWVGTAACGRWCVVLGPGVAICFAALLRPASRAGGCVILRRTAVLLPF